MNNDTSYWNICDHPRLTRINDNFVRCLTCGCDLISQKKIPRNKTVHDFTAENRSLLKSNKFFNNLVENKSDSDMLSYYTDKDGINTVTIDWSNRSQKRPPQYIVIVNGIVTQLTEREINKLLSDLKAIRISLSD